MKKIAAILFALVLCATSVPVAFAASGSKIAGINEARWYDGQEVMTDAAEGTRDLASVRGAGGTEVRIYLDADMFVDEDGEPFGDVGDGVSKSDISKGKVGVSVTKQQNPNLVEEISIEYDNDRKTSYIKIEFIDPLVGTGRRTWQATLRLKVNGTAYDETAFEVEATLSNEEIKLTSGTDYVHLNANEYATADVYLPKIRVDLDGGVNIIMNMYEGKKYYAAIAVAQPAKADNAEIVMTYNLSQTNMAAASNICRISLDEDFYIYGADGVYLGKTGDDLPVARVYHFTKEQVEELELEERGAAGAGGSGAGRGGR